MSGAERDEVGKIRLPSGARMEVNLQSRQVSRADTGKMGNWGWGRDKQKHTLTYTFVMPTPKCHLI